jgi:hypothetical protein
MTEATGGASLALEAFDELTVAHELRRDQFQSDGPFGAEVRGEIDRAHAALTEQAFETILAVERFADESVESSHVSFPKSRRQLRRR